MVLLVLLLLQLVLRYSVATEGPLFSVPADVDAVPWGPSNIGSRLCPVRYPFQNETNFCVSVGRQRAIVTTQTQTQNQINSTTQIACVTVPWRLRSDIPQFPDIGVYATTQQGNVTPVVKSGNRIEGEICFETVTNSSLYAIYYLPIAYAFDPWTGSYHSHFWTTTTPPSQQLATVAVAAATIQPAALVRFESRSSHDVRSPMEFSASNEEVEQITAKYSSLPYLTWVSTIDNTTDQSIRMTFDLPLVVIQSLPNTTAIVSLDNNSNARVVQIVVYAATAPIKGITVDFHSTNVEDEDEEIIKLTCLQTFGVNYRGDDMIPPPVELNVGQVGQLLILIEVTRDVSKIQEQKRRLTITPKGLPSTTITLFFVSQQQQQHHEPTVAESLTSPNVWRLSRLSWLNSRIGLNESMITRPYSPITYAMSQGGNEWILGSRGRTMRISSETGLPVSIVSNDRSILSFPVTFELTTVAWKEVLKFRPNHYKQISPTIHFGPNHASAWWSVPMISLNGAITSNVHCFLGYDGHLDYSIEISADKEIHLTNTSLTINLEREIARFAVGAGLQDDGDWFPYQNTSRFDFSWQDTSSSGWKVWIGDVDAGLFLKLKGTEDAWNEAIPVGADRPSSWSGSSGVSGGIQVSHNNTSVRISAFSGPVVITTTPLLFNFSIMATPTKGDYIHTEKGRLEHYKLRHFHVPYGQWDPPPDPCSIFNSTLPGPTTLILHQSNRLNPYINWPFHPNVVPKLSEYVANAQSCGVSVKIYYTVHELTNHCVELHALAGLNGEVLLQRKSEDPPLPGPGKRTFRMHTRSSTIGRRLDQGGTLMGNEWLLEHMVHGYEGGWFTLNPDAEEDAAVSDNVTSRFLNYYIEGQRWLYDNIGIGGLYYDGFNSERRVQQRIRRMSDFSRSSGIFRNESEVHEIRFDVHGRPFDYTELMPYVDSMWTSEGIDFTRGPAYWLVSISSLPFGIYGEMLGADEVKPVEGRWCGESCANKYRGMLFGMTNRMGWNGKDPNDNLHLWKLWDDISIHKATMYGWWNNSCPIRVLESATYKESKSILATAYVRRGNLTLVAIASWEASNRTVILDINWDEIGLEKDSSKMFAPFIPSFNTAVEDTSGLVIRSEEESGSLKVNVTAYEGWLLVIS